MTEHAPGVEPDAQPGQPLPEGNPQAAQGHPAQPQQGYPAAPQDGYPAQSQQGYPAQPQQGYPSPQQGQPAPQGYPAQQGSYPAPPQQTYAAQPQQGYPAQSGAPSGPRPSPFAGIPISDYVTDLVAGLLLLISLSLPWNMASTATDRVEVVLITILSLLSLSVHYLGRFGAFPSSWDQIAIGRLRAAINAPYFLLVAVYVVLDLLASFISDVSWAPGLGGAAALGMAGAILAAVPRNAERGTPEQEKATGKIAIFVVWGFIAIMAVSQLLAIVAGLKIGLEYEIGLLGLFSAAWAILLMGAVAIAAAVGVARKSEPWRLVVATIGVVAVIAFIFLLSEEGYLGYNALTHGGSGLALLFVPVVATLVLRPVIAREMTSRAPHENWLAAARHSFEYVAGIVAASLVLTVLAFIRNSVERDGTIIVLTILSLFMGAAAVFAWLSLRRDVLGGRVIAIAASAGIVFVGFISIIIRASSDYLSVSFYDLLLTFGLPALALYALIGAPSVRAFYASNKHLAVARQGNAAGAPAYGQHPQDPAHTQQQPQSHQDPQSHQQSQGYPPAAAQGDQSDQGATATATATASASATAPASAPVAPAAHPASNPTHPFTAAQASDPGTDLAVLAQIAQDAPELRAHLAANPSTYPDLLGWLGSLNDPGVNAALAARSDRG